MLSTPHHPLLSLIQGGVFACRRRCFPAAAPQASYAPPHGRFRRTPNSSKPLGLRALLTRRALRRPPLSRPRHMGDPLMSHRLVRVVGGLLPPPADPPRFISGMSPPKPLSEKPQNKRFLNQHWFRKTLLILGSTLGYIEFF